MKKLSFLLWLIFLSSSQFASVKAILDYATFNSPGSGPYVEIYLSIDGKSLKYDSVGVDSFQARLEVGYLIKAKNSDKTINLTKFELVSPIYSANSPTEYLIDLKRLSVPSGSYDLQIILKDINSEDSATIVKAPLELNYSADKIQFSQIQLTTDIKNSVGTSDFSKQGIEIRPHPSAYYPEHMDVLGFYTELYNTDTILGENELFLIEFKLVNLENAEIANNIRGVIRQQTAAVIPIVKAISIEELPSGNYELVIEARNRENEVLARSVKFIQRNNPTFTEAFRADISNSFAGKFKDIDVLSEHIRSLYPISSESEKNLAEFRLKNSELEELQSFLFNFWYKRNQTDPENSWNAYKQEVLLVNENYGSSIRKGYETDPGVVYLKYGKPNTITKSRYEPGAYPYEVWQYNQVEQRTNAKFVFYNSTGEMGEYELLHSNVPGELANYRWKAVIYGRTESFPGTDDVEPNESFGKEADDFYNNPR